MKWKSTEQIHIMYLIVIGGCKNIFGSCWKTKESMNVLRNVREKTELGLTRSGNVSDRQHQLYG